MCARMASMNSRVAENDLIYISDPIDYIQNGMVYIVDPIDQVIVHDFEAGIIPGEMYFN